MATEEHAYNIYAKQLFTRGYGYPLWHPEPTRDEIEIGDVGYRRDGAFWRLFNATLPKDQHKHEVPESYQPFRIRPMLNAALQEVIKTHLCSASVDYIEAGGGASTSVTALGAGLSFKCNQEQGAFVVVDLPADRSRMHPSKSLASYIRSNIEKWHEWNTTHNDLDIPMEDLIFVSGTVKTNDWGLGAFLNNGRSCEAFVEAQAGPFAQASFNLKRTKGHMASIELRTRPGRSSDQDSLRAPPSPLPSIESGEQGSDVRGSLDSSSSLHLPKKNQCLFIHYYKVKRRLWMFNMKTLRAAAGPDERDHDHTGDGGNISVLSDDLDVVEEPHSEQVYDPVGYLLDYILNYEFEDGTQVEWAVAGDTHLYALFEGDLPMDIPAALEKMKPPVMFLDDDREMACLATAEWSEEFDEEQLQREWVEATKDLGKGREDPNVPTNEEFDPSTKPDESRDSRPALDDDGQAAQTVVLQEHTGGVTCIAFSPDGRYIASGSEDTTIILRDGTTGEVIHKLVDHQDSVWTLAFSPDSTRLASGASDGLALIWDVEARSVIAVLDGHNGVVQTISYSPDGSKIATSSVDFTIRLWDAITGQRLHELESHKAVVMSAIFSPNGRWIASCAADYKAKIWDADTGALVHTLDAHTGVVWSIAFSPDSRRVITGSDDTTSRIWNAETGEELVILREHHGPVWSVAFSPDGKHVMTASNDATIKICDSFSGERAHAFDRHDTLVNAAVFSPDGQYVASSAGDNAVMVWNTRTGKSLPSMVGHMDKVTGLQFSPESDRLVSCSDDGTVRIWTLPELGVEGEAE